MPQSTYRQCKARAQGAGYASRLKAFLISLVPKPKSPDAKGAAKHMIYGALYDKKQHILIGERITPLMIKQAGSFANLRRGYLFVSGKPALIGYAEAHGYGRVLFTS